MQKIETMILMAVLGVAIGLLGFSLIFNHSNSTGFAWAPSSGDTLAPTIRINSPPNNAFVQGVFNISVTATDNVVVRNVYLIVDGQLFSVDSTTPYDFLIKSYQWENGIHSIQVIAVDEEGNSAQTQTILISVQNDK